MLLCHVSGPLDALGCPWNFRSSVFSKGLNKFEKIPVHQSVLFGWLWKIMLTSVLFRLDHAVLRRWAVRRMPIPSGNVDWQKAIFWNFVNKKTNEDNQDPSRISLYLTGLILTYPDQFWTNICSKIAKEQSMALWLAARRRHSNRHMVRMNLPKNP